MIILLLATHHTHAAMFVLATYYAHINIKRVLLISALLLYLFLFLLVPPAAVGKLLRTSTRSPTVDLPAHLPIYILVSMSFIASHYIFTMAIVSYRIISLSHHIHHHIIIALTSFIAMSILTRPGILPASQPAYIRPPWARHLTSHFS